MWAKITKIAVLMAAVVTVLGFILEYGLPFALEPEIEMRDFSKSHRNPHCKETATLINWHVQAREGWSIIAESIVPQVPSKSKNSSFQGVRDISPDGFYLYATVSNNGECVHVLGKRVTKDARGSITIRADYKEQRSFSLWRKIRSAFQGSDNAQAS